MEPEVKIPTVQEDGLMRTLYTLYKKRRTETRKRINKQNNKINNKTKKNILQTNKTNDAEFINSMKDETIHG